jgi:anaphase-promoting complex subunit 2
MTSNASKEYKNHRRLDFLIGQYSRSYKELEKHKRIDVIGGGVGTVLLGIEVPGADRAKPVEREVLCGFGEASFFLTLVDFDKVGRFEEAGGVTFKMLAESLSCTVTKVSLLSKFWVSNNMLQVKRQAGKPEEETVVRFISSVDDSTEVGDSDEDEDGMVAQQAGGDKSDQVDEVTALYESYVLGMLANLGALPLERIHGTLKMFASVGDYPYEANVAETTKLLGAMVKRDLIELIGGTYKIK